MSDIYTTSLHKLDFYLFMVKFCIMESKGLSDQMQMDTPEQILDEVLYILSSSYPNSSHERLKKTYSDTVGLFNGRYQGYRNCSTAYHNLGHTTDVFLAMARMIHGCKITGEGFLWETAEAALISALMHDTGYIQEEDDDIGTGGKFTIVHVDRSIKFAAAYLATLGVGKRDIETYKRLISTTNLSGSIMVIPFRSPEEAAAGKMLFASDILAQMSDRLYLEKLLYLFLEFKEAGIFGIVSEDELYRNTLGFYETICKRLDNDAGYSGRYMRSHFMVRWGVDKDLYMEGMEKNINFLRDLLDNHEKDYMDRLKRGGIVKKLKGSLVPDDTAKPSLSAEPVPSRETG